VPFRLDEDQPRLNFAHNPLKTVVWQMRFPPLLAVNDPIFAAKFQAAIRADYPIAEPRANHANVTVGEGASPGESGGGAWHFRDEASEWVVALHQDFLSLETSNYIRFEDFRTRLERLLDTVEDELKPSHVTRLGLRYVDEIRPPNARNPADFTRYLNQDLIGVVAGKELASYVIDALQLIRLEVSPYNMTIRHGFVGPQAEHPDAPFYLIDTDAYELGTHPYSRTHCLERSEEFKRYCWNVFRQSIRDDLLPLLKPTPLSNA
jgi:uncharacterized protein (TIGR04255 family)